eukprot:8761116-Alexandrium_andersonii.AAC.1
MGPLQALFGNAKALRKHRKVLGSVEQRPTRPLAACRRPFQALCGAFQRCSALSGVLLMLPNSA